MMKRFLLSLVCSIALMNMVQAVEYISTNSLAVVNDKAYLIETNDGTSSLVQYDFPILNEVKRINLDSDFSYANATDLGIVIYNYTNDIQIPTDEAESKLFAPSIFKEIYELKTYNSNLDLMSTKNIENSYYYDYVADPTLTGSADAEVSNKCKGKKAKKEKCDKVPLTKTISK